MGSPLTVGDLCPVATVWEPLHVAKEQDPLALLRPIITLSPEVTHVSLQGLMLRKAIICLVRKAIEVPNY